MSNKKVQSVETISTQKMISIFLSLLFILISCVAYVCFAMTKDNKKVTYDNTKKITSLENRNITNENKLFSLERQISNLRTELSNSGRSKTLDGVSAKTDEKQTTFAPTDSTNFLSFDKLIGFKSEIVAAEGFIDYLRNPSNYKGIGDVECPFGILMYGTAGTGKTTLARSIAKETGLPFFEVASSTFSQKYKGVAIELVQDLFKEARKAAENNGKGAIIFLDECETIFADLITIENGSEIANVVNQFKTEMTSSKNKLKHPIFVIGATNHYSKIDEAIKSRFTYNIEVKTGNFEERKKFLEFMMQKRQNPFSLESKQYLLETINKKLDDFKGEKDFLKANRTLENLLKSTVSIFARNRNKINQQIRDQINIDDLKEAFKLNISQDPKDLPVQENVEYVLDSKTNRLQQKSVKNETNQVIKSIYYNTKDDNQTIKYISEFDSQTGKQIKRTEYRSDGKTVWYISEFDPQTSKENKKIIYIPDSKTINCIINYNPQTGKEIQKTYFASDGKTISYIIDYEPQIGTRIKQTQYKTDGKTINCIINYDPQTGKEIKGT
ncbi:DUF2963 domain-containing protein [Phytoplasma sp.]|uniref:DUF2963 domain-containing protein n=1 Tax=Phytoplasma sp. TaxID=2155 RepID=UPI002B4070F0|nr:DUF2963 domain-containing protein [Phytoplasma sp.]